MESFKLEKGKKYNLSHHENGLEGEFVGVLRKSCGNYHQNKLVFKLHENSFCTAEPETRIKEDGTICISYDVYSFKNTLADLMEPQIRPKETIELI